MPDFCLSRVHLKFAIVGLDDFDRDLEFEHDGASGSHPVPLQSSGCPRTDLTQPVFPASAGYKLFSAPRDTVQVSRSLLG